MQMQAESSLVLCSGRNSLKSPVTHALSFICGLGEVQNLVKGLQPGIAASLGYPVRRQCLCLCFGLNRKLEINTSSRSSKKDCLHTAHKCVHTYTQPITILILLGILHGNKEKVRVYITNTKQVKISPCMFAIPKPCSQAESFLLVSSLSVSPPLSWLLSCCALVLGTEL